MLWTDMFNPDNDTDVPSGFNDDAEMERTPSRTSDNMRLRLVNHSFGDGPPVQSQTSASPIIAVLMGPGYLLSRLFARLPVGRPVERTAIAGVAAVVARAARARLSRTG